MSRKTLNAQNLQTLGVEKLAELLIEISTGSADMKRRLRLELSHNLGSAELAREVRKRLASLRKAKGFVSWRKRSALVKDLETQCTMIVDKIAPDDPATAFDLLWQFIDIAPNTYERVDDSSGYVGDLFRSAIEHFEDIAPRAMLSPKALADRVWPAIEDNGYGQWDGIITLLAPSLGTDGLNRLKDHVQAYADAPVEKDEEHEAIQFIRSLRGGNNYAAERKARYVKSWLQEIAVAAGDTESYVAQYSAEDLRRRDYAARVAQVYLADGRAQDALDLLQAADPHSNLGEDAWNDAYIAALLALDRAQDAQDHRWHCFRTDLNTDHLRAYLKQLPDFDDVEAEERAKAHVLAQDDLSAALRFCLEWPDLVTAAQLVETRDADLNGDAYWLLTPAAEALRTRHPRAAVLLWRAMIDFALEAGKSSRYGHAADHLNDCTLLDAEITDYGPFPDHGTYLNRLNKRHERKTSFWSKVRNSTFGKT